MSLQGADRIAAPLAEAGSTRAFRRRGILKLGGTALGVAMTGALFPALVRAQTAPLRFVDMHAHLGFRRELSMREAMTQHGMLIVAENVVPDGSVTRREKGRLRTVREANPGELRHNFETAFRRRRQQAKKDGLIEITSVEALERVVKERVPGIVLVSEGADFLEGDIAYLDKARADGLVHLQLVHYYSKSSVGDISTEQGTHNGLSPFGKEIVRACNRLGILLDVAHATSAGIEQALDISTRPLIYSHGHVSAGAPSPSQDGVSARAIHAPLARRLVDQGGVVGLWPLWSSYAHLDLYCDELMRLVQSYGVEHVGIGTDMFGLPRSIIESYREFASLPGYLAKRGMHDAQIEAVLGGNYIRVLRQALTV